MCVAPEVYQSKDQTSCVAELWTLKQVQCDTEGGAMREQITDCLGFSNFAEPTLSC